MFRYDAQKTKSLAKPADRIELEPTQEQLIRDLAGIVGPAIGLDKIPCHGLWLSAVRAWQLTQNRPASDIEKMAPPERARAARQIRDHFTVLAREMLHSPEEGAALERAIQDAFDHYMKNYNRRPR